MLQMHTLLTGFSKVTNVTKKHFFKITQKTQKDKFLNATNATKKQVFTR